MPLVPSPSGGGRPSSRRVHDHPSDVDCRGVRSPSSSGGKDPYSPSESALRIGGKAASCFGEPPDASLLGDDLERGPAERKSWVLWRRRWRERLGGGGGRGVLWPPGKACGGAGGASKRAP